MPRPGTASGAANGATGSGLARDYSRVTRSLTSNHNTRTAKVEGARREILGFIICKV